MVVVAFPAAQDRWHGFTCFCLIGTATAAATTATNGSVTGPRHQIGFGCKGRLLVAHLHLPRPLAKGKLTEVEPLSCAMCAMRTTIFIQQQSFGNAVLSSIMTYLGKATLSNMNLWYEHPQMVHPQAMVYLSFCLMNRVRSDNEGKMKMVYLSFCLMNRVRSHHRAIKLRRLWHRQFRTRMRYRAHICQRRFSRRTSLLVDLMGDVDVNA
jgi:hypothetical protein